MAIVKFVSDKDCQVFIDMELVGKVAPDSMLKITLETGGYLVQIKDDDGHLIKEYDLEIKVSDNQVLQKINESNCQIEDVIGELRNDSSLRFYHQRAIFCYNGNYGYINSQYKIAIEPIYSYAENFTNGLALVKKIFPDGEKATVIDVDGNISLDRWYDYVGSSEKTILMKSGKNFYVLSKADYSIINHYFDAKYDGKADYIPVYKEIGIDDMYGFINKSGSEVVPFIYDYVWNFDKRGLAKVKRFGRPYVIDKKGNLYVNEDVAQDSKKQVHDKEILYIGHDFNSLSKAETIYKSLPLGEYCGDEYLFYGLYPIKEKNFWGIGGFYCVDSDNEYYRPTNKIEYYKCDRIIFYNPVPEEFFIFRKEGICTIIYDIKGGKEFGIFNGKEFSISADEIYPIFSRTFFQDEKSVLSYFTVKRNRLYGIANINGDIIFPIEYDLIIPTNACRNCQGGDIVILWKGGKCTLYSISKKKILMPFENDDIIVNETLSDWAIDSTFSVKRNGKYGLVGYDCDARYPILPFIYDSIQYKFEWALHSSCEKIILRLNGKMGTWQIERYGIPTEEKHYRIEPIYDECLFIEDKQTDEFWVRPSKVAIRNKGKWALINRYESPNMEDINFKYNSFDEIQEFINESTLKSRLPDHY